ncbi:MAG TPA: carboxypeptidase-like regulatory domain-containing protein [Longimicrobiales bacterium]|nr:carboxypeptidase-like regulatory domain-containing protein [Longimicrobiales bacterium]
MRLTTPLMLLLLASPAAAQSVTGRVVDDATGAPLMLVELRLLDETGAARNRVASDSAGIFRLHATAGRYIVEASLIGYSTVRSDPLELRRDREIALELRLGESAIPLDAIRVVAERRQQYRRIDEYYRRLSSTEENMMGWIRSRDEIEALDHRYVKDYAPMPICVAGECVSRPNARCTAEAYLNAEQTTLTHIDMVLETADLEGVEYYEEMRVPPKYRKFGGGPCAVVLFWTRPDRTIGSPFTLARAALAAALAVGVVLLAR